MCFRPGQSYRVHTILLTHEINLCIICFIEWAPKEVLTTLKKIYRKSVYRMHEIFYRMHEIFYRMHEIFYRTHENFTGRMNFLPDA